MPDEKTKSDRKTFIGGSDAAAVMGLSRWETPLNVYYKKRGEVDPNPPPPDPMREKRMMRGKLMEPVVIKMLQREYPLKVIRTSTEDAPIYYNDPRASFLAAQIDFEWEVTPAIIEAIPVFAILPIGSIQNGEVKTTAYSYGEWGEEQTDEIPIEYAIQGMHGLGITGRQATFVALLQGSDNLMAYQVMRNEKVVSGIHERLTGFWNNNVIQGVPPAPIVLADVYKLLSRRQSVDVQASVIVMGLVAELMAKKIEEKEIDKRIEELQFAIGKMILGEATLELKELDKRHRLMLGREVLLTIASAERRSIPVEDFEKLYPELASKVINTSRFLQFRLPRAKKRRAT